MPLTYDEYLQASNGTGEAVRSNVVVDRPIGSTEINVDTVLNWPTQFIATSGVLDTVTGTLDPDTVTVFFGHINGTYLEIDEYAPGYSDNGNATNEIIVLKPTTSWSDKLVSFVKGCDSRITATTTVANGAVQKADTTLAGTGFFIDEDSMASNLATKVPSQQSVKAYVDAQITAAKTAMRIAVGDLHLSTSSTNPATSLGYGTWVAWGAGRVPVGVDTSETEFVTVEKTGGEKTHTLVNAEMPVHSLVMSHHGDEGGSVVRTFSGTGGTTGGSWISNAYRTSSGATSGAGSYYNPSVTWGSNTPHNNLQPYITCYMWKRTA